MNCIILKISGKVMDNPSQAQTLWQAITATQECVPVAIVHGGGKQVDQLLAKLGEPIERIDGIRVTPESQIDIVAGVLAGNVNLHIVGALRAEGVHAVGLSLGSHGVLDCRLDHSHHSQLGRVGRPTDGDARLVRTLLEDGYVPVVSSIGLDPDGGLLNINADDAAAMLAASLQAQSLLYISDVQGITDARGDHLTTVEAEHVESMISSGTVAGGMAAKLRSASSALGQGVTSVQVTSVVGASAFLRNEPAKSTVITLQKTAAP